MQKRVNFVVTDLDDTIWQWLTMWHATFKPFFDRIQSLTSINEADLIADFKQLHQKYGTSESSFIIDDLLLLTPDQREAIHASSPTSIGIMHEYNSNRKNSIRLYDGVLKTLMELKSKGVVIVGFTESHSFYTKFRLKTLNLDGLFDCIYAPIEIKPPPTVKRYYSDHFWEPKQTDFRYLAREVRKPNAEILDIILRDFGAEKHSTIYIGDKLDRDVYMAEQAGITSVYAKYGHNLSGPAYDLLRGVTHWTDEDVAREIQFQRAYANQQVSPDVTLNSSFDEILEHFAFYPFPKSESKESLTTVVDVWKKVIDVQQHFNDLALRIKNYALTLFTAIIAGVGLLEKDKVTINWLGHPVSAAAVLSGLGVIVLAAFWYIDRYWYHKLLLGAVEHGRFIESTYAVKAPEIALTEAIGKSSPQTIKLGKRAIHIHSNSKFHVFYGMLALPLILLTVFLTVRNQPTAEKNQIQVTSPKGISVGISADSSTKMILKY